MKTLILLALLPAMVGLSSVPRHIIERVPLAERNGKVTFVDKYSDGTIDRSEVPQIIKLENRDYAVATNIARVTCVSVTRTNALWRMAYEVRSVDGSIRTNINFANVDQRDLQAERRIKFTNALIRAKQARANAVSNPTNRMKKAIAASKISEAVVRARTMKPSGDVLSESVNAKGQLVQKLTNGQTRIKDLPRRASVPVQPAKKKQPEDSSVGAMAAAAAGAIAGAGAVAAAKKKK